MALTRRAFLGGWLAGLASGVAGATPLGARHADALAMQIAGGGPQDPAQTPSVATPYQLITPPVAADEQRVREFFSYACPYCRQYHNGLANWGRSLPPPLRFVPTPIITDPDDSQQVSVVYGRLICGALAPEQLPLYDIAAFDLVLGPEGGHRASAAVTPERVLHALSMLGIRTPALKAYVGDRTTMSELEQAITTSTEVVQRYGITSTPSVAILGKLIVTPEHANGNPQQFVQLLNGLISQVLA